MDRIVVGFDGSEAAEAALRWAVSEARHHGTVLSVWTVSSGREAARAGSQRGAADASGPSTRTREETLSGTVAEITGEVPTDHRFVHGEPAAELVAACAPGDLLVVGARVPGGPASALLGSVSRACLHAASCPVVIVHAQHAAGAGEVVVGIDGSPAARRALVVAAEEARLRGTGLRVVHAVHWDHYGGELLTPTERDLLDWGERLVRTELEAARVTGRPVVVPGRAAEILVDQTAGAALLVVGSRGFNPLTRLLLGWTAGYCARRASCPVLVVRPPAGPAR